MSTNFNIRSTLFWRLGAIFLVILLVAAGTYMYIALKSAQDYSLEVNQQLGRQIAQHTVQEIKPLIEGEVNKDAIHDIMHSMMVINPDVEVYLLNPSGEILTYVAPYKEVKLEKVNTQPILDYLGADSCEVVMGDDPREPGQLNIFSAAPIEEEGELLGYIYIILASQLYASASDALMGSYVLSAARDAMVLTLVVSLILGLVLIWIITRNLGKIASTVRRFQNGELGARIRLNGSGEFSQLAGAFDEMADTIEANVEEIRSVEKLRRELVANVSHDLRTPIASIAGYAETLLIKDEEITDSERKDYLETIVRNSERLGKLVSDLFELSKLEAREKKLEAEPLQLADLLQDVSSKYKLIAREKGVSIHTLISSSVPMVEADIALIDRALQNIIDNAIRHCESGDSIHIEIHPRSESVEVRIADTGEGISDLDLPHIFDRYSQAGATHATEGSGLGLTIVKKILEMHNSSIQVASKLKEGTTFWFELPKYSQPT